MDYHQHFSNHPKKRLVVVLRFLHTLISFASSVNIGGNSTISLSCGILSATIYSVHTVHLLRTERTLWLWILSHHLFLYSFLLNSSQGEVSSLSRLFVSRVWSCNFTSYIVTGCTIPSYTFNIDSALKYVFWYVVFRWVISYFQIKNFTACNDNSPID